MAFLVSMDLTSRETIKELLKKYNATALKRLGQHFLVDRGVLRKIIEAAELSPKDTVLEIGPGVGTLTQELAKRASRVIAVEKDPKMIEILKETIEDSGNVEIIQGDILKLRLQNPKSEIRNPKQIQNSKFKIPKHYKIVANLPYYITSPVIRKFLTSTGVRPLSMLLMVQKEVAQRIVARPPDMNLLAISVQFYAKPEIVSYVSKKSFWPQPKVDSAIIKITPYQPNKLFACAFSHRTSRRRVQAFRILFFKIVKAGFSQPRKQLINNLSTKLKLPREKMEEWLLKNNIQPQRRAETLSINNWLSLTKTFPK